MNLETQNKTYGSADRNPPKEFLYKINADGKTCEITEVRLQTTRNIVIPETVDGYRVTSIGEAFKDTEMAVDITIPRSLMKIHPEAFSFIGAISVPHDHPIYASVGGTLYSKDMTTLIHYAATDNETSFTVPESVTRIGDNAFKACMNLTAVNVGSSVLRIGDGAFRECSGLTDVTFGNAVQIIGNFAFYQCTGLTHATLPSSVGIVGNWAFGKCTALENVTLPESLKSIGNYAFCDCQSLVRAIVPDAVSVIGYQTFWGCTSLADVKLGKAVRNIKTGAFGGCTGLTEVTVPDAVFGIDKGAFWGCEKLTDITLGKSVAIIDERAFEGCQCLSDVVLPKTVKKIGPNAFKGTGKIHVSEENPHYSSADGNLYSADMSVLIHYAADKKKHTFTVPDAVTRIAEYAFFGCDHLKRVILSKSVASIGERVFSSCTKLETVRFVGKKTDWEKIDLHENWNADSHVCNIRYRFGRIKLN